MLAILATQEAKIRTKWFQASLGKMLSPISTKKLGVAVCLLSQLQEGQGKRITV
jgi:hypothetical protein